MSKREGWWLATDVLAVLLVGLSIGLWANWCWAYEVTRPHLDHLERLGAIFPGLVGLAVMLGLHVGPVIFLTHLVIPGRRRAHVVHLAVVAAISSIGSAVLAWLNEFWFLELSGGPTAVEDIAERWNRFGEVGYLIAGWLIGWGCAVIGGKLATLGRQPHSPTETGLRGT